MRYFSIWLGTILVLFFTPLSSHPGNSIQHSRYGTLTKLSFDQNILQSKVRPYTYNGRLKHFQSSFFQFPFFGPNYEFYLTNERGKTIAFLDISDLAMGTSLANLFDKTIMVKGPSSAHKYRGVVVIKAQTIVPVANL